MIKKTGVGDSCYQFKGWPFMLRTMVALLLLSMVGITAQAADAENNSITDEKQAIGFNKMPEFVRLKEVESIELTYVPIDTKYGQSSFKINGRFLPKITAKKWSNGKYSIEGEGVYEYGSPCFSYEYNVDLKSKIYTLKPVTGYDLDDSYLKLQAMESKINSKALKSASDMEVDAEVLDGTDDVCQQQYVVFDESAIINKSLSANPGVYDATVSLRTRDVPDWTITKTTDRLRWIVYNNGTVNWLYWYVKWYAVNPSPINTHWYISHNTHWGPYFGSGSTNVSKGVYGVYYNWDWLWDDASTHVSQYVKIQGNNNATYTYFWNHSDWGEDSWAIWGVITLN